MKNTFPHCQVYFRMSSLLEIKRIVKQNKDLLDIISNYFDSNDINAQQKLFN